MPSIDQDNNINLNGREIIIGGNIIIPMAIRLRIPPCQLPRRVYKSQIQFEMQSSVRLTQMQG